MTETILDQLKNLFIRFEILNFGHCDLFVIWDLGFGIFCEDGFLAKTY